MRLQIVFSLSLATVFVTVAAIGWSRQTVQAAPGLEIAVTIDDLPVVSQVDESIAHYRRVTTDLLEAVRRHKVPAVGFVNEGKLERNGVFEPDRLALLQQWIDGGLELANHTFSHIDLNGASVEAFKADVQKGEPATARLLSAAGKRLRYFRHPYLHTGRDAATREAVERFLAGRGYRIAPVTVDASDYMFAAALDRVAARGDRETVDRIVTTYLAHTEDCLTYSEQQAGRLFGRPIRQVLLLHANTLNSRSFDALAERLTRRGYSFVSLDRALDDPAYSSADSYVGEDGIGWLERWSLSASKGRSLLAAEPEVPAWVMQAANRGS